MHPEVLRLVEYIEAHSALGKQALADRVQRAFSLVKDRSVYYCDFFAIRFSSSSSSSFSNTVVSLSTLQKYDDIPFIVCLVTPNGNRLFLANSTLINKVSHSSQALRQDNIRGSINGSDIIKVLSGIDNSPSNFADLFAIHSEIGFGGNLPRIVENTTGIVASRNRLRLSATNIATILAAPIRAVNFNASGNFLELRDDLEDRVARYHSEIVIAGLIDNVNIRGRVIEYLIAGDNDNLRHDLIVELRAGRVIPRFETKNALGDYIRDFESYHTATDIKTKIMVLQSNPKAYNVDKFLEYLSGAQSVFMFFFVGIDPNRIMGTSLISVFQRDLLGATLILKHWAGRNSRGVAQFNGEVIKRLIDAPNNRIDIDSAENFLRSLVDLGEHGGIQAAPTLSHHDADPADAPAAQGRRNTDGPFNPLR